MAQSTVPEGVGFSTLTTGRSIKTDLLIAAIILAVIAGTVSFTLWRLNPPAAVPASAPATEFSSARALEYLKVIAQKPHPVGSGNHKEVRAFIMNELTGMGFQPSVHKTSVISQSPGAYSPSATVENVVAQLKGAHDKKAVLIVGHYDSMPISPGASDNGAAVAAMLETARALKTGQQLENDVIFLFTDAEEWGLLGAKAFVDEHPWAKRAGLVINLEARGNGGPSILFETSLNNGRLISEFAKSAPHPSGSSLYQEAYKLLPNDTDLSIFKRAGFTGLNIAFIDGATRFHNALDNLSQIDERSLQHHGSYTLALARHFGNLDLDNLKSGDAVYFDLFGSVLVHYSAAWVIPSAILVLLLFAGVWVFGYKKNLITLVGTAWGFLALFTSIVLSTITAILLWLVIRMSHGEYVSLPQREIYDSNLYVISFVALALAVTSIVYILFWKRASVQDLTAGALLWFVILMTLTSLVLPGASYLFTWPLFFSILGLGFMLVSRQGSLNSVTNSLVLLLLAIPGIILFTPVIYMMFVGLTVQMAGAVVIIVALLLGLLVPQFMSMSRPNKWLLPAFASLICAGLIVTGGLRAKVDSERPKPNNIFYVMDASSNEAVWASYDAEPDEWTSQFLTQVERGRLGQFLPTTYPNFLMSEAPLLSVPPPNIEKLDESTSSDGSRTLRLRVTSPRQAPVMSLYITSETDFQVAAFNNKPLQKQPGKRWSTSYYGLPAEGFEITLESSSTKPFGLKAVDLTYELEKMPTHSFNPRPPHMVASGPYSDASMVSKSFVF